METKNDEKKITENDEKRQKDWLEYKFWQKIWHKKKKVMWLVKPVNYWGIAIHTQSN